MGFNLEDLNLQIKSKLILMVAIVVMSYVLSIQEGLENKAEYKKKYKNKSNHLAVSYFRQGLSILKTKIWSFKRFMEYLNVLFNQAYSGEWLYVQ